MHQLVKKDHKLSQKNIRRLPLRPLAKPKLMPNEASFYINLTCLKNTVKLSKDCLVDKSNKINQLLLNYGIKQEDILTTSVNMHKSYTWRSNSRVFEGYNSSSNMIVTIKKIDDLDKIYTELLENRNLELSGLNYKHSEIDSLKKYRLCECFKKS